MRRRRGCGVTAHGDVPPDNRARRLSCRYLDHCDGNHHGDKNHRGGRGERPPAWPPWAVRRRRAPLVPAPMPTALLAGRVRCLIGGGWPALPPGAFLPRRGPGLRRRVVLRTCRVGTPSTVYVCPLYDDRRRGAQLFPGARQVVLVDGGACGADDADSGSADHCPCDPEVGGRDSGSEGGKYACRDLRAAQIYLPLALAHFSRSASSDPQLWGHVAIRYRAGIRRRT